MKKIGTLINLIFLLMIFSCSHPEWEGVGSFDISPNDAQIVFSYAKKGLSSLYTVNSDGTYSKKIVEGQLGVSYYQPKYSPNGKKIIFIANKKGSINSTICLSNIDGSFFTKLTDDKQIITQATFSTDGEIIYFCKANVYKNYSPVARKSFHDFDIYSLKLEDKTIRKISNYKWYGLGNLEEIDSVNFICELQAGMEGGIYLYAKDKATAPKQLVPINNPRHDASLYYTPAYSKSQNMLAFTAPYELYVMDLKNKNAELVLSNVGHCNFAKIVFFKQHLKILFTTTCNSELFSINTDGTGLRSIPIIVK